ncbi:hypothetical protein ACIRRX_18280 [Streptomyces bacillaris]
MSWDSLALLILALAGAANLLLSQIREVLEKTAEVIHAWHDVRRSLREQDGARGRGDPSGDDDAGLAARSGTTCSVQGEAVPARRVDPEPNGPTAGPGP